MADKLKELCKWKTSDYAKETAKLEEIILGARFVCVKCGRAACKKKWLCKPQRLGDDN